MLAHFSVAFAAFVLAIILGEWQMFVRSPLHAWVNNPRALLSFSDHAWHGDGLCSSNAHCDGVRLRDHRACAETSVDWREMGVGRLLAGYRRHVDGLYARGAWQSVCPLYILPADDWQPVLLFGCRPGRRRLMDMGRVDVDQSARVEDRKSR